MPAELTQTGSSLTGGHACYLLGPRPGGGDWEALTTAFRSMGVAPHCLPSTSMNRTPPHKREGGGNGAHFVSSPRRGLDELQKPSASKSTRAVLVGLSPHPVRESFGKPRLPQAGTACTQS